MSLESRSAEARVDWTSSMGPDTFLVNILPYFEEILCIITGKYPENWDVMLLKSNSIGRKG